MNIIECKKPNFVFNLPYLGCFCWSCKKWFKKDKDEKHVKEFELK